MKKYISFLFLSIFLVGCGNSAPETIITPKTETPIRETHLEQKKIVASFYPLAFMAEQIAGKNGPVTNLAGAADVHEYTPTPQDMVRLNNADLFLYQGAALEPWAEDVIATLETGGVRTLEVSEELDLKKMEAHEEHHDDEHEGEEGHHDEDEDDHHEDEHDEHHHGEFDPHTWLDPVLAQDMVDAIAAAIIAMDPINIATYEQNATALKQRFMALDEAYATGLSNCQNDEVIVSHDAYGYLAARYNMELHAIAGLSTQDEPSAKILAELKQEAEEGITHVLTEENNVQEFASTLARETGLETLSLNPLGRGPLSPDMDFFDVMEANLQSFKIALSCE